MDLLTLSLTHNTDKEISHKYVSNFYSQEFEQYRNQPVTLFEVGVYYGGSMRMWRDYFANCEQLIAADITNYAPDDVKNAPKVKIHLQNAYDPEFAAQVPALDIAIDDGPHDEQSQIEFIKLYLPKINPGGLLVIEDLLDYNSIEKFREYVSGNEYSIEIKDIRPLSGLPQSVLFIVRRQK